MSHIKSRCRALLLSDYHVWHRATIYATHYCIFQEGWWCGWRDSNPHAVRRLDLNQVRLPISPHPHYRCTYGLIPDSSIWSVNKKTNSNEYEGLSGPPVKRKGSYSDYEKGLARFLYEGITFHDLDVAPQGGSVKRLQAPLD